MVENIVSLPSTLVENRSILAKNFDVLSPDQFLSDFEVEAKQAKHMITLQCMQMEDDQFAQDLLRILSCLPNTVHKQIYLDEFSNLIVHDMPRVNNHLPVIGPKVRTLFENKSRLFSQFEDAGIQIQFTNIVNDPIHKALPFVGRNHMKGVDIDNGKVFYFGGLNFNTEEAKRAEFMVKFTGDFAHDLSREFGNIQALVNNLDYRKPHLDYQVPLGRDGSGWLLIDSGHRGISRILTQARQMIQDAQSDILLTSQWLPDEIISAELSQAVKNRKKVEVITGKRVFPGIIPSMEQLYWLDMYANRLRRKLQGQLFPIFINSNRLVHAKLLIIDKKKALFGSHNLSYKGTLAETQEVSIETTNPILIANLLVKYEEFKKETDRLTH